MATFLVTGAAGFVGLNTMSFLAKEGHKVIGVDNHATSYKPIYSPVLAYLEQQRDVDFYKLDLTNYVKLGSILKRYCIEYVIHLAALPSVQRSVEDPNKVIQNNVTSTLNILEWCRYNSYLKKLVYASSSSCYGGQRVTKEDTVNAPLICKSPYAASKASGELLVNSYFHTFQLPTVVLRYFNVFGIYQNPKSMYSAVIPVFISKVIKNESPIIYGSGMQTRDFTYVENIAFANYLAATSNKCGTTYDIGCGNTTNLLELLDTINHLIGKKIEPIFEPARFGDVAYSCAYIIPAEEQLHYSVRVSWYEGLRKTINYYKESSLMYG